MKHERFIVELTRETKSESYLKGHLPTLTFYKNIYSEAHGSSVFTATSAHLLSVVTSVLLMISFLLLKIILGTFSLKLLELHE